MYKIGWQDSEVSTKYVYQRIHEIMDTRDENIRLRDLSIFYSELGKTYFADTGEKIGNPQSNLGEKNIL